MENFKSFILSLVTLLLLSNGVYSQSVSEKDNLEKQIKNPFERDDISNYKQLLQNNEFDKERFKLNKANDENLIFIKEIKTTSLDGNIHTITYNYSSEGKQISRMSEYVSQSGSVSISLDKFIYDDEGNAIGSISEHLNIYSDVQWKSRNTYYWGINPLREVKSFSEVWDGEQWVPSTRSIAILDDIGREVTTYQSWNGTEWEEEYQRARRETKTYDSEGNILERLTEQHNGANWINDRRYNTSYNSDNNSSVYYTEKWEGGMWQINSGRFTRVYDSNDINILLITESWDGTNWNNYTKEYYTHNSAKQRILNVQEYWENNNWVNRLRQTYSYNNDGYQLTYLKEFWKENTWQSAERGTYNYDYGAFEVSFLSETWKENNWENVRRSFSTFSHAENKTMGNYEEWSNGIWTEYTGGIGFLDLSGKLSVYGASVLEVTYTTITDIRETGNMIAEYSLKQNYPNPFNPTTEINYSLPKASNVQLIVYNMLGQEISTLVNSKQEAGKFSVRFDASNLTSGVYFYKIQTDDFSSVKKMLLIK